MWRSRVWVTLPPRFSCRYNCREQLGVLQDMANLLETSIRVLALVDAEWQPLSLELHPDLLTLLMTFVSKLIRLHLLARRMPYAIIVQLYTLTYNCVQVSIRSRDREVTVLCRNEISAQKCQAVSDDEPHGGGDYALWWGRCSRKSQTQ